MPEESDILNATITQRIDLSPSLAIIKIRPDTGEAPAFEPGQFIVVALPRIEEEGQAPSPLAARRRGRPRLVRRAYSIASAPKTRDHVELLLVLVQGGKLTPRLWDVHEDGRVWLDDKVAGEFTLEGVPTSKDLVMVATGTGIAPYVSMLRQYRGTGRWRTFVLIHGVRVSSDLAYRDELEQIAREDPSVLYVPTVTREPAWLGRCGRCQQVLTPESYENLVGRPLHPDEAEVFLCGNPAMIDDLSAALADRGFVQHTRTTPGTLHFERYW